MAPVYPIPPHCPHLATVPPPVVGGGVVGGGVVGGGVVGGGVLPPEADQMPGPGMA